MRAFARETDPITSHNAADSLSDKAVTRLEAIVEDTIRACGQRGATWDEIHRITSLPKASISPRFKPLVSKGRIYARSVGDGNTIKRSGDSGRGQIVWFHTDHRSW